MPAPPGLDMGSAIVKCPSPLFVAPFVPEEVAQLGSAGRSSPGSPKGRLRGGFPEKDSAAGPPHPRPQAFSLRLSQSSCPRCGSLTTSVCSVSPLALLLTLARPRHAPASHSGCGLRSREHRGRASPSRWSMLCHHSSAPF